MKTIHGGDVYANRVDYDFSANINPLGINKRIFSAAVESMSHMAQYPDIRCSKLRDALSKKLGVDSSYLYFGNGAADVLYTLILASKPQKALLVSPTFAEYEQALRSIDCEVVQYHLREEDGFVITDQYIYELTKELDMIILCNPNNPVGNTVEQSMLLKIVKRCKELDIMMVVDECFCDFLDDMKNYSMLDYIEEYDNLVLIKAFTKMYAMAGLRLGYLINSNHKLLNKMLEVSQPWSVSIPAQEAGFVAVQEEEYVNESRLYVKKERTYLCKALDNLNIKYYKPEANYILFYDEVDWYTLLLKERILIRDCSNYKGLRKGYFRIAVRTREENEKLIHTMKKIVSKKADT